MFRHLLVPLDGSRLAEAVLPVAASLATRAKARVTLLHVMERGAPATIHGDRHLCNAAEAERYLEHVSESVRAHDVDVTWHVHEPVVVDVPQSLVNHADELGPNLVVLTEHGAPHVLDWLTGSIAQRVVSRGRTPVLLVRGSEPTWDELPFQRILVPLDGHAEHEQGLATAKELARAAKASLVLLTVVPTRAGLHGSAGVAGHLMPRATRAKLELAVETAQDYLAEVVTSLREDGLEASGFVVRGDPLEQIRSFCAERQIDTIALGTHGKAGTEAFWSGSLAQRLIRACGASLLLTPVGTQAHWTAQNASPAATLHLHQIEHLRDTDQLRARGAPQLASFDFGPVDELPVVERHVADAPFAAVHLSWAPVTWRRHW